MQVYPVLIKYSVYNTVKKCFASFTISWVFAIFVTPMFQIIKHILMWGKDNLSNLKKQFLYFNFLLLNTRSHGMWNSTWPINLMGGHSEFVITIILLHHDRILAHSAFKDCFQFNHTEGVSEHHWAVYR